MIRFINRLTGTLMLVDAARAAEYLAAGHFLLEAADVPPATDVPPAAKEKDARAPARAASPAKPETAQTAAKRTARAAQKKRG